MKPSQMALMLELLNNVLGSKLPLVATEVGILLATPSFFKSKLLEDIMKSLQELCKCNILLIVVTHSLEIGFRTTTLSFLIISQKGRLLLV